MREQQPLRRHRARGVNVESQSLPMPVSERAYGILVDRCTQCTGVETFLPNEALKCLERRYFSVVIHPAQQHGDQLRRIQQGVPFDSSNLVDDVLNRACMFANIAWNV